MKYWLVKSEPDCYSIDDLKRDQVTHWDGVRNYQARNMLRDAIQVGDSVFFYHSNTKPPGIAGIAKVVKAGYPDHTAWDPSSDHPDPQSTPDKPRWYMIDIRFVRKLDRFISLDQLKQYPQLTQMQILQKGNRLSVTPVSENEWAFIVGLDQ